MLVVDLVEGRFELAGIRIHGELLHDRIIHHERQAINESFFRDGLGVLNAWLVLHGFFRLGHRVVFGGATGEQICSDGNGQWDIQ